MGGHNLYENVDEEEGIRIVQKAVDAGVTFIDTADIYGMGRSEELVGKALAGRMDSVIIATKGANMFDGKERTGVSNDPGYLRQALEASLKRLGREYVDLYYIHRYDEKTPPEASFGALMKFKEAGLIRAGGVSNFALPQLKEALKAGPIDALQSRYNILQREVEAEILPFCKENRISFIPWGPLAFGLLGGKYTRDFKLPESDWRHNSGAFDDGVFENNLDTVDKVKEIAGKKGAEPAQLALQWLLAKPAVDSVIAGAKRVDQLEQNLQAEGVVLTSDEVDQIDTLIG
jgi:aryl-alcohol dehydrogenase-like predicted oxidoreductase